MNTTLSNALVLVFCWIVVAGVGGYLTFFHQPRELHTLEELERTTLLRNQEADALLAQSAVSREQARDVFKRWNARYKVMPASLRSYEVVGYLNDLTRSGFETFDVSVQGVQQKNDFSTYTLAINGQAYYSALYQFIWHLENNRSFYRVLSFELKHLDLRDTDTSGRERLRVLVSFTLTLEAYFGGAEGMSAAPASVIGDMGPLAAAPADAPPPVPASILPRLQPVGDPFRPIILESVPPNTYGLVDVERDALVSIADGRAIFRDSEGYRTLGVGDDVYLGRIVLIDPEKSRVVAYLNRGGIVDEVELTLGTPGRGTYRPVALPASTGPTSSSAAPTRSTTAPAGPDVQGIARALENSRN